MKSLLERLDDATLLKTEPRTLENLCAEAATALRASAPTGGWPSTTDTPPPSTKLQGPQAGALTLERVAAENLSDPATDDLTVPLAIKLAEAEARVAECEERYKLLREGWNLACQMARAAGIEAAAQWLDERSRRIGSTIARQACRDAAVDLRALKDKPDA